MTAMTIDEAVRRVIAVGGDPDHIGGVDNFCWPEITYDPVRNPDGKLKAAHLVRSCLAMRRSCLAMGIPLLSGKDSMYVDGDLPGPFGERHRVSALPTLQFTVTSVNPDINHCVTCDPKQPGEYVFLLGPTRDELGGSEYYEMFGETGLRVPRIEPERVFPSYRALAEAIGEGLVSAAHAVHRGGLGVHLALMCMAGGLGLEIELGRVICETGECDVIAASPNLRADKILYSESGGRLLITVPPECVPAFAAHFAAYCAAPIGRVTEDPTLRVVGMNGSPLLELEIEALRAAWKRPFGDLV
jgi:phosphoribosylformylglycinamidine synthase